MEFTVTQKTETISGFTIIGTIPTNTPDARPVSLQLNGLSEEQAKAFTVGKTIKVQ